jgi:hypothetical protein
MKRNLSPKPTHYPYVVYEMAVYGNVVGVALLVRMVGTSLVVDCSNHTGNLHSVAVPAVHRHDTPTRDVHLHTLEAVRMIEGEADAAVAVHASTWVGVSAAVDRDDVVNTDHWDGTIPE